MTIPTIAEVVRGGVAHIVRLDDENLWYSVDYNTDEGFRYTGWQFPIPRSEAVGAIFHATERPIFFMRWIRLWIKELREGLSEGD